MTGFTAEVENLAEFENAWGEAMMQVRMGAQRGVQSGVREGAAEAKARHRFRNRTGDLERSITGQYYGQSGDNYIGWIKAEQKYASYVEEGTKPHEIVPRRATVLHWEEPQGDHHFARRVMHPGTTALPFMSFAYFKSEAVILRELEVGVVKAQAILDR